jgi:hypothetical protein
VTGDLRRLHPALYRAVMTFAIGALALGVNFLVFTPTFLIFGMPNQLWGVLLVGIGVAQVTFLSFKRIKGVRMALSLGFALYVILAFGTSQPLLEGKGSLQLPIMYATLAVLLVPLLLEAPVNPWTKK